MRHRFSHATLLVVALLSSCDKKPPDTVGGLTEAPLEHGAVARISGQGISPILVSGDTVTEIASSQRISPKEARERAISDALFAAEAIRQKQDVDHPLDIDAVLARHMAADFLAQAKAQGPVADDEIDAVTEKRWYDFARPEAVMTVTAVVETPEDADAATAKRAEAVALAIREAVLVLPGDAKASPPLPQPTNPRIPDDGLTVAFRNAALSVKNDGFLVKVEQEWPMAKDNRAVLPVPWKERQTYEAPYVAAATALSERGTVSPVFRTKYGFHVVMLLTRYPAVEVSIEERRKVFEPDVYDLRARKIADELLARLHKEVDVAIERNADSLLAQVKQKDLVMELAEGARAAEPRPGKDGPQPSPSVP